MEVGAVGVVQAADRRCRLGGWDRKHVPRLAPASAGLLGLPAGLKLKIPTA